MQRFFRGRITSSKLVNWPTNIHHKRSQLKILRNLLDHTTMKRKFSSHCFHTWYGQYVSKNLGVLTWRSLQQSIKNVVQFPLLHSTAQHTVTQFTTAGHTAWQTSNTQTLRRQTIKDNRTLRRLTISILWKASSLLSAVQYLCYHQSQFQSFYWFLAVRDKKTTVTEHKLVATHYR